MNWKLENDEDFSWLYVFSEDLGYALAPRMYCNDALASRLLLCFACFHMLL
jgi:hypothetical protein